MKVVSYEYRDKRASRPQFLYVDADYDATLFPQNVREIIEKAGSPRSVSYEVIPKMGNAAEALFKLQHYLDSVFDMTEHS